MKPSRSASLAALVCATIAGGCGDSDRGSPRVTLDGAVRDSAVSSQAPADRDASSSDARPPSGSSDSGFGSVSVARDGAIADAAPGFGSADAGRATVDASTGPTAAKGRPVFVAVGYSGLRLVSYDLGLTWNNERTSGGSGDDENLLRAVAIEDGQIVAVGWKAWTSRDGTTWTEHPNPARQWMGGLRFGNGVFVAVGGWGSSMYSQNGESWTAGRERENNEPARTLAFGNGMFVAATDQKHWWQSIDGRAWTLQSGTHGSSRVLWCDDHFSEPADCDRPIAHNEGRTAVGEGIYVSVGSGKLERSVDGVKWATVWTGNYLPEAVTFGYLVDT